MTTVAYDLVGENGTYVAASNRVDLNGTALTGLQTFVAAVTSGQVIQVTVKQSDTIKRTWLATFADAAPDTLTRVFELGGFGTLTDSSAVEVELVNTAASINSQSLPEEPASTFSPTVDNVTMIAERMNVIDPSSITAARNLTVPVPQYIGQEIAWRLSADAPAVPGQEMILLGAATVTIDGGTAATERTRYFIKNESGRMRATSLTNWELPRIWDGRIPCVGVLQHRTVQTIADNTVDPIEHDTVHINVGGCAAVSTGSGASGIITIRRACNGFIHCRATIDGETTNWADGDTIASRLNVNATLYINATNLRQSNVGSNRDEDREGNLTVVLSAGDTLTQDVFQNPGGTNPTQASSDHNYATLGFTEELT